MTHYLQGCVSVYACLKEKKRDCVYIAVIMSWKIKGQFGHVKKHRLN